MAHELHVSSEDADLDLDAMPEEEPLSDLASLDLEKGVEEVTSAIEWVEDALSKPH